ncbi:hypothetical protein PIB30_094373, partial [Stylosanthes scabra]|nr:hypothetical protein [Stylosanthes scabra]
DSLSSTRRSYVFGKQGTPIHIQSIRSNDMCDVYISSGLQQLDSFTSDLFHALILEGVNVLRSCRPYTNDLILSRPIEGCRVSIIVFTIDYASSGVNHIYTMKEMDYNECVELFSWRVFKKVTPERSFSRLIDYAIEYSDGLPFALVAIGSVLFESIEEWESVLQRLERFPLQDVWHILKESIDSLGYNEQGIFREIAYLGHLLNGMDRNDICQILKDAGHMV